MYRISLVIPVYNEASNLRACLDAIARQTVPPFEVMVVDNNSTDNTVLLARKYSFVRVISEKRQGVVYARDTGFDAAKGEIIGRIDADTILSSNWIESVQRIFATTETDAVSGSIDLHDVPYKRFFSAVDLFFRRYLARNLSRRGELFLFGGNMAVRRTFWQGLRGKVCHNGNLHEDIDLAAHAAHSRWHVSFHEELRASVSARRIDSNPRTFYKYTVANSRTYRHHGLKGRFYMYPVVWIVLIFYPLLRFLYRGYDSKSGHISIGRMMHPTNRARVSPVSESV